MVRPGSTRLSLALVIASTLVPGVAGAQAPSPLAEPPLPVRQPSLIVSMAASPLGLDDWRRSDGAALVGSVQFRLKRFLFLEGETTRWTGVEEFSSSNSSFAEHRQVWTIGANLLIRGGTSRVTGFAGAGLGGRFEQQNEWTTFTCLPGPGAPAACTGEVISRSIDQTSTGLTEQFVVGGEFWVARRLAAYGGARFALGSGSAGFAPLAGVRVAARTTEVAPRSTEIVAVTSSPADASRALGKDVRVTLRDGTKHQGKLERVSGSEVTVGAQGISLADVQKIEKVGNATRNATAIGVLAGLPALLALGSVDLPSDMTLAIVGAGVGAGIGVGVVIDAVRRPGNVVYVASGSSGSIAVRPILTPGRKGLSFTTNW